MRWKWVVIGAAALHLLTHEVPIAAAAAWGVGRLFGWW